MFHKIENFIVKHNLIKKNDTIIVGLSGGPDSVFLLHFLASLQTTYNLSLIAAHINHEWRTESDQEQIDCQRLAQTLHIPFVTIKRSEFMLSYKHNGSQEEYGRKIRRQFFEQVMREYNADSIALAHHAQDQEETFFIRLMRGTSLTGLTGIKPHHGPYIRPLLETDKDDILAWLHAHNIPYALDASNNSPDYLRNRIRLNVLPALRACDQRFASNFLTTLNRLKAAEQFLEQLTTQTFATISSTHDNQCIIDIAALLATNEILLHRLILHWLITEKVTFAVSQALLDEIIRFLRNSNDGTHTIHNQWSLIKKQKKVYIKHLFVRILRASLR
jgi:tRNA(Ile)-lysidine synthase